MSWRAAHEGPDKFLARSEHSTWGYARRWLLEMMAITHPPGIGAAFSGLNRATPDCDCMFTVGGHAYALTRGETIHA